MSTSPVITCKGINQPLSTPIALDFHVIFKHFYATFPQQVIRYFGLDTVAAVCWGVGMPVMVEEIQVDPPKATEVRVKMLCASICHTDISSIHGSPYVKIVFSILCFLFRNLLFSSSLISSTNGLVPINLQVNHYPLALGHEGVG